MIDAQLEPRPPDAVAGRTARRRRRDHHRRLRPVGRRRHRRQPRPRGDRDSAVTIVPPPTPHPGCSPWSCTPTCRGWRTTAAGRSARSGCTRRGPASYLPVMRVLRRLAAEGRPRPAHASASRRCSPPCSTIRTACARCTTGWATGSCAPHEAALRPTGAARLGTRERRAATVALEDFELRWRHGGSSGAADAGRRRGGGAARRTATHPFLPLLHPRLRAFALAEGRTTHMTARAPTDRDLGARCGYTPGMEHVYAAAGVRHFLVDGPALRGDTALGRPVARQRRRRVRSRPAT